MAGVAAWALVLLVLAPGCGSLDGYGEPPPGPDDGPFAPSPRDGGVDVNRPDGGPAPSPTSPTSIVGVALRRHWTTGGTDLVIDDALLGSLSVLVPAGDGTLAARAVTRHDNGYFTAADVPAGPYYLRWGTGAAWLVDTDRRMVRLEELDALGRADVAPAAVTAPGVKLELEGLAPAAQLQLSVFVPNARAMGTLNAGTASVGADGTVRGAAATYTDAYPTPTRVEPERGDLSWLMQQVAGTHPTTGLAQLRTERLAGWLPLALHAGGTPELRAKLLPTSPLQLQVDWRAQAYDALRAGFHPQTPVPTRATALEVTGALGGAPLGFVGYPPPLLQGFLPNADGVLSYDFWYAYPPTWAPLVVATRSYDVPWLLLPGTTKSSSLTAWSDVRLLADVSGRVLEPRISPPREVVADGQPAQGEAPLEVSARLRVTWKAPELGSPSLYWASVYRLRPDVSDATRTARAAVAHVLTQRAELQLPAGLLQLGESYVVVVRAWSVPAVAHRLADEPLVFHTATDTAWAAAATSRLVVARP